ncbi:hypothetical protein DFR50_10578 [Roseiarcus fermentans]|uniref:YARHG domain-containing protein n=1 Tax=Roseiarcus fermentans TaxID=1473586 RepID=A0A366FQL3_9HYPH|nr:hypothetical protein [Roseiarcus fermentans]RBP16436.1 hypothetical protein DFR50_10578 [Roseiarcus fermentans]
MKRLRRRVALALLAATAVGPVAADSPAPKRDWRQEKCFRYGRDWDEALRRFGRDGLSAGFLAGNGAFLKAGCVASKPICPKTARDRKLADALAIRVVNEGMSPTFLPFDCPPR